MAKEVVLVDVDDLGIDTTNIRGGEWDYNEDLVQDIKNNGIQYPLIVRRAAPKTGKKYAIVCGSRRFNAAIKAGLTEVPCFIEEMDDVTALGRTIAENIHRKDIPAYMYALKIGQMYKVLDHKGKKGDIVKIIMGKTGFAESTVYTYLNIAGLPSEIIELMKEPEKRSKKVVELLKRSSVTELGAVLSLDKAAKIASELGGFSLTKMFEVAAYVMSLTKDVAFEIIERVKTYPKMSMEKIHDMVSAIPKGARLGLEFGSDVVKALDEACMRKSVDRRTLVINYVEEGLRRDGFL